MKIVAASLVEDVVRRRKTVVQIAQFLTWHVNKRMPAAQNQKIIKE